jgi:hypothetical protein
VILRLLLAGFFVITVLAVGGCFRTPVTSNCVSSAAIEIAQKEAGIGGLPPSILRTPTPLGYQWQTRCTNTPGSYLVDLRTSSGMGWTWQVSVATREAELLPAGRPMGPSEFGRVGPIWLREPRSAILKKLGPDANQRPECMGCAEDARCTPALSYSDGRSSLRIIFSGAADPIAEHITIRNRNDLGAANGKFKPGVPPLADWHWMGYSVFKTQYGPLQPDVAYEQFTGGYSAGDPSSKVSAGLETWEGGILQFTLSK